MAQRGKPKFARGCFRRIVLLCTLGAVAASPVLAADPTIDPPPETPQETAINAAHNALLREGRYEQLDKEMTQIQSEYERGIRDDISLLHLSYAFYDTDPGLEAKFTAWIAAYPQSYAARQAQGIYFRRIARKVRGISYSNQTQPQQLADMSAYLDRAMESYRLSLPLTAKPVLTYYNMLCVARLVGDRQLGKKMLDAACQIDPKNFIVRYKYMTMLETRWGGSLQDMQRFRTEVQQAGLPHEQISYFDQLISEETAWLAEQGSRR